MKMSKFLFFSILFYVCLSYSCSSDETISESASERKQIAEYSEKYKPIGEIHNKVLDSVFKKVHADFTVSTRTKKSIIVNTKEDVLNLFKNAFSSVYPQMEDVTNLYSEKAISQENISIFNKNFDISYLKSSSINSCSAELQSYIDQACKLMDIHGQEGSSTEVFNKDIEALSAKAVKDIKNSSEIEIYFIGISVAKASYQYWLENKSEWESLIKSIGNSDNSSSLKAGNTTSSPGYNYSNVGKQDVKGAVVGAIGGALVGGLGAGPGALGGACTASIEECIEQLWNNWFD